MVTTPKRAYGAHSTTSTPDAYIVEPDAMIPAPGQLHMERLCHPELFPMLDLEAAVVLDGPVDEVRTAWRDFCMELNPPRPPGIRVEDRTVHVNETWLPIRIYRPSNEPDLPTLVYIHGGGQSIGSSHFAVGSRLPDTYDAAYRGHL